MCLCGGVFTVQIFSKERILKRDVLGHKGLDLKKKRKEKHGLEKNEQVYTLKEFG